MKQPMYSPNFNRRDLLKTAGLAAGAGALGLTRTGHANTTQSGKPKITVAGYKYDRILPIAEGRVGMEGFEVRYTYHGDTRHVRVTIPKRSSRHYEPSEILCIRAIRDLTELSFWGQELVFADEGEQFHVDWERFERIINEIE